MDAAMYRELMNSSEFLSQLPPIASHSLSYIEANLLVQLAFGRNLDDLSTRTAIHMAPANADVRVRMFINERVDGSEDIHNLVASVEGSVEPGVEQNVVDNHIQATGLVNT